MEGKRVEELILEAVLKRNKILNEIININKLAIMEFHNFDDKDNFHFLMTRKYFIDALEIEENKIIAYSMMDWSTFMLSDSYKDDYIYLTREKNDLLCEIINQDRVLESLSSEKEAGTDKTA